MSTTSCSLIVCLVNLLNRYLVSTLVHIACCVVVDSEHRYQSIGVAICLTNKNHSK